MGRDPGKPQHRRLWQVQNVKSLLRYWIPFFLYTGFLTYLLFRPSEEESLFPLFDKGAHLFFFSLLGGVWVRLFHPLQKHWPTGKVVAVAMGMTVIYGGLTEWGQGFTSDRTPEWGDLLMDAVGGACGGWLYCKVRGWLIWKHIMG